MSMYDNAPVIRDGGGIVNFVANAPIGAFAEYVCPPALDHEPEDADPDARECKQMAWEMALLGKVTLFKKRRDDGTMQSFIVRITREAAHKYGMPQPLIGPGTY